MQPLRTGKPCGTKHKAICIPFHSRFQVEWFVKWTCEKICAEVCQFKMTGKVMVQLFEAVEPVLEAGGGGAWGEPGLVEVEGEFPASWGLGGGGSEGVPPGSHD